MKENMINYPDYKPSKSLYSCLGVAVKKTELISYKFSILKNVISKIVYLYFDVKQEKSEAEENISKENFKLRRKYA
jgi:hypothetical protein